MALGECGHGAESVPSRELEQQHERQHEQRREGQDARCGEKCRCCIVVTLSLSKSLQ
jgi:hypothetical protein